MPRKFIHQKGSGGRRLLGRENINKFQEKQIF